MPPFTRLSCARAAPKMAKRPFGSKVCSWPPDAGCDARRNAPPCPYARRVRATPQREGSGRATCASLSWTGSRLGRVAACICSGEMNRFRTGDAPRRALLGLPSLAALHGMRAPHRAGRGDAVGTAPRQWRESAIARASSACCLCIAWPACPGRHSGWDGLRTERCFRTPPAARRRTASAAPQGNGIAPGAQGCGPRSHVGDGLTHRAARAPVGYQAGEWANCLCFPQSRGGGRPTLT